MDEHVEGKGNTFSTRACWAASSWSAGIRVRSTSSPSEAVKSSPAAGHSLQVGGSGQPQLPPGRPTRGGQQVPGLIGVVLVGLLARGHPAA